MQTFPNTLFTHSSFWAHHASHDPRCFVTPSHTLSGGQELETADCLAYNFVSLNQGGAMTVEFKGPSNCHIGLMSVRGEDRPLTEIILGGWDNQSSVIRVNRETPDRVKVDTKNLLTSNAYTKFYIRWQNGSLWVRKDNEHGAVILEGKDSVNFIVKHVAFRSGWGARGQWRVQLGDHSIVPIQGGGRVDFPKAPARIEGKIGSEFAQRGTFPALSRGHIVSPSPPNFLPCLPLTKCYCRASLNIYGISISFPSKIRLLISGRRFLFFQKPLSEESLPGVVDPVAALAGFRPAVERYLPAPLWADRTVSLFTLRVLDSMEL